MMDRNWTDRFIDIPFKPDGRDRSGCDCWGLVHLIYRERLGIELPDYRGIFTDQSLATLRRVAEVMNQNRESWQKVDTPQPYDVVMMRSGKYTWHVGIVVSKNYMLHIMEGIDSCLEEYTGIMWKNRVAEFRRYPGV